MSLGYISHCYFLGSTADSIRRFACLLGDLLYHVRALTCAMLAFLVLSECFGKPLSKHGYSFPHFYSSH